MTGENVVSTSSTTASTSSNIESTSLTAASTSANIESTSSTTACGGNAHFENQYFLGCNYGADYWFYYEKDRATPLIFSSYRQSKINMSSTSVYCKKNC